MTAAKPAREPVDPKTVTKLKLVIAYDGANYAGWQIQKIGLGVQQRVEEALAKIFPTPKRLHSSSRTDTGVHAIGMVAHVEIPKTELKMPVRKVMLALNAHLPADVRIMSVQKAAADFHARFNACGKQYRYYVWNHSAMNPLLRTQAWHVPKGLDIAAMREAAKLFIGKHDFKSFAANRDYAMENTVRTMHRCDIQKKGSLLTFIIEGDGFLYKMCRGIAGTLVQLGQGKIAVTDVKNILAAKDRRVAGMTAPAHGLVLWKVFYKKGFKAKKPGEEDLDE
ncbi:MAG TPA: tRNA pseudouridine(38-40) synthase TruA [Verrucomicrobiae bacterium]